MSRGAIVFEGRLRVPGDIFCLDKFRAWMHSREYPEQGRISFVAGEIEVDMSPEELETHNKAKGALFVALSLWIQEQNLGELLADRAFLVNREADLATEPDITFCSWDALRSERVHYGEWVEGSQRLVEVVGSPDLVIEVVSQNSVRKDTVSLRERYWRAGITEYWIVDARGESIDFHLLLRGEHEYEETSADADGYRTSHVLKRAFLITRGRNPVGGYSYHILNR